MVQIQIKRTNGEKLQAEVELEGTVLEMKQVIQSLTDVPAEQQRLIYKGKILKDELTAQSYGIAMNDTVYFVKSVQKANPTPLTSTRDTTTPSVSAASATPASTTSSGSTSAISATSATTSVPLNTNNVNTNPFGGAFNASNLFGAMNNGGSNNQMQAMQQQLMQNPELMQQMMQSPMMDSLLNNPEIIRNMLQSNPAMRQFMENNPHISHILNDPEMMRRQLEIMTNPVARREFDRSNDLAMRNLDSMPGGFNAMARMYNDMQEPMMEAAASGMSAQNTPAFPMPGSVRAPGSTSDPSSTSTNSNNINTSNSAGNNSNPWASSSSTSSNNDANTTNNNALLNPFLNMSASGNNMNNMMDPEMLRQMSSNPMFQAMMDQISSNPEMLQAMLNNHPDPQVRQMMNNPMMQSILSNPEMRRMMFSPEMMQAAMSMNNSNLNMNMPAFPTNFGSLNNLGNSAVPTENIPNPEEAYASQLEQLADMGFSNRQQNIRALQATFGNVNAAVERILSGTV